MTILRHCERSVAIQRKRRLPRHGIVLADARYAGLPRFARNDGKKSYALLAALLLAACSSHPAYSPKGGTDHPTGVKLGKPYSIDGHLYTPKYESNYTEIGLASWYGPGFDGRMTASGERYDSHDLTAAHRTLPMPALVRVTVLSTGRSIVLKVNDRGPFHSERILDMSSGAADALGTKPTGTVKVRVEYLDAATQKYLAENAIGKPDWMKNSTDKVKNDQAQYAAIAADTGVAIHPAPGFSAPVPAAPSFAAEVTRPSAMAAPFATLEVKDLSKETSPASASADAVKERPGIVSPSPSGRYLVQTSSFKTEANARNQLKRVKEIGPAQVIETEIGGAPFYRVVLGPFEESAQAQQILESAKSIGFIDARIIVR